MRASLPRVLPLLALACGAGAMTEEFSEFRLGLGVISGFEKLKVEDSHQGVPRDPGNDGDRELSAKAGLDAQPGLWMGSTLSDGVCLVFGIAAPVRSPGGTSSGTRDTGTPNGSGTGNVQLQESERIRTVVYGAKFSAGVGWIIGPMRFEVTPFAGAGAISARIDESRTFVNNPNNLAQFTNWNSSFSNRGTYFEYGVSASFTAQLTRVLQLGAAAGWQAIRSDIHVDQHGPGTDSADWRLQMRTGAFFDAVLGVSF